MPGNARGACRRPGAGRAVGARAPPVPGACGRGRCWGRAGGARDWTPPTPPHARAPPLPRADRRCPGQSGAGATRPGGLGSSGPARGPGRLRVCVLGGPLRRAGPRGGPRARRAELGWAAGRAGYGGAPGGPQERQGARDGASAHPPSRRRGRPRSGGAAPRPLRAAATCRPRAPEPPPGSARSPPRGYSLWAAWPDEGPPGVDGGGQGLRGAGTEPGPGSTALGRPQPAGREAGPPASPAPRQSPGGALGVDDGGDALLIPGSRQIRAGSGLGRRGLSRPQAPNQL